MIVCVAQHRRWATTLRLDETFHSLDGNARAHAEAVVLARLASIIGKPDGEPWLRCPGPYACGVAWPVMVMWAEAEQA